MGHSSGASGTNLLSGTLATVSSATLRLRAAPTTRPRRRQSGQSVVEFALVVPVLLLIVIAVADFGRLYNAAVAVESAAREAADYGAFQADNWSSTSPSNITATLQEMERRACTAAQGSHLEGYAGAADGTTCSNPSFSCSLEWGGMSTSCASSGGIVGTNDCSAIGTQPKTTEACTVHVHLDYDFRLILGLLPFPDNVAFGRDSRFRITDLTP
jgi:TadE-like protein